MAGTSDHEGNELWQEALGLANQSLRFLSYRRPPPLSQVDPEDIAMDGLADYLKERPAVLKRCVNRAADKHLPKRGTREVRLQYSHLASLTDDSTACSVWKAIESLSPEEFETLVRAVNARLVPADLDNLGRIVSCIAKELEG